MVSPRATANKVNGAKDSDEDEGVVPRPVKMSAVPRSQKPEPTDLPAALREIDRLRSVQEKNAASAMAATRRAFDEQARLEKRIETLERELETKSEALTEGSKRHERDRDEYKKALKTAKKKAQKLEVKLEEQRELARRMEAEAGSRVGDAGGDGESRREIELTDRCARQEGVISALQGQIDELKTTLEDERSRGQSKASEQSAEIARIGEELRRALEEASTIKEESDMTVESMRAALEAQISDGGDRSGAEEIESLRARVEELSAAESASKETLAKLNLLQEKHVALERLLKNERANKAALRLEKEQAERRVSEAEAAAINQEELDALKEQLSQLASKTAELEGELSKERQLHVETKEKAKKAESDMFLVRNTSTAAEKAISAARAAMDSAEARATQSEKLVSERDARIQQLSMDLDNYKLREEQLNAELGSSSVSDLRNLEEKQRQIDELSVKIVQLESKSTQVDELKRALLSANDAATAAAQSIEESEAELLEERKRVSVAEKNLLEARRSTEVALDNVSQRDAMVLNLKKELEEMSNQVKEAHLQLQMVSVSSASQNKLQEQLDVELDAANALAKAAESRAAGLTSQLKIAEDARDEAVKDVARLKHEVDMSQGALEGLKTELANAQNSLKSSKAAASRAVQEAVSASGRRAQELAKQLEEAKTKLSDANSIIDSLKTDNGAVKVQVMELETLVSTLRENLETIEQDAAAKRNDQLDMEYMRREEDLRAEISDLTLELQEVREDSSSKVEQAERRASALDSQIDELERALSQSRDEIRQLTQDSTLRREDLTQETLELRKKLVEAQEIAANSSGSIEAVKRRYEARLRDAGELAEKQIISLVKELDQTKEMMTLAQNEEQRAREEAACASKTISEKETEFAEQLERVRNELLVAHEANLSLTSELDEMKTACEELRLAKDAMEDDLVETCSLLEKVSAKANDAADNYKQTTAEMNATMDTMKQKLEGEVLLAMDLTKEKEFIIKELETRQAELSAQVEALKEKSLSSSSKLVALETNLKEASIAERERLLVLQNENKRLEKRLKDTWTALQGAHAVVEQTKTAAKDAVRNANAAAAKAEKVAIKAKRELEEIRSSAPATAIIRKVTEAEDVSQMQSSSQLSSRHRSATSPQSMSQRSSPAPRLSPVKPPSKVPSIDDEMQRASDLLERLSRASREPSLRDDGSVGKSETSSQIGAVGAAVFGYRGA